MKNVFRIALLTSSRADYGIYRPLLKRLQQDSYFDVSIVAFGTHTSKLHGYTIQEIQQDGFEIAHHIEHIIAGDSPETIATAMGLAQIKFSHIWANLKENLNLIICLGDRYEMYAAVLASVPFQIPVAHLHGGETTLGAIDNIFRHALTLSSTYHFASTENHAQKITALLGTTQNVYNVGSLSLDNLHILDLLSLEEFEAKFRINLYLPTILFTFHPETVAYQANEQYAQTLVEVLHETLLAYQVVITLPNADTMGNAIRQILLTFGENNPRVFVVESFGTLGYFSCMKYCSFLLGNSSSGIIEAASFGKYVLNVGKRQEGRYAGANVLHLPIEKKALLDAISTLPTLPALPAQNIYGDGKTAPKIIDILRKI